MTEGFPAGKQAGAVLSARFIPAGCSPALADTHRKQMDSVLVSVGHGHEGAPLWTTTLNSDDAAHVRGDTECGPGGFHAISRNVEVC